MKCQYSRANNARDDLQETVATLEMRLSAVLAESEARQTELCAERRKRQALELDVKGANGSPAARKAAVTQTCASEEEETLGAAKRFDEPVQDTTAQREDRDREAGSRSEDNSAERYAAIAELRSELNQRRKGVPTAQRSPTNGQTPTEVGTILVNDSTVPNQFATRNHWTETRTDCIYWRVVGASGLVKPDGCPYGKPDALFVGSRETLATFDDGTTQEYTDLYGSPEDKLAGPPASRKAIKQRQWIGPTSFKKRDVDEACRFRCYLSD